MQAALLPLVLACALPGAQDGLVCSTFSIAAVDTASGECGVAVASRVLAVGTIVPWVECGSGAVATQALANVSLGPSGLELLEGGLSAGEALDILLESDSSSQDRQLGIVDSDGGSATFTGSGTSAWAGGVSGPGYAIQGNILTGPEVVAAMEEAFLGTEGPLAYRLVRALAAGDSAGGDSRGRQSAAVLVHRPGGGYQGVGDVLVDIRVDDHADPVGELSRIYALWEPVFMIQVYADAGGEPELGYLAGMMDRALSSGERDPQTLNAFAWTLAERGLEPETAVELATEALMLAPEDTNIMDTLAEALYAAGRCDEAVARETVALRMEPGSEWFRDQLAKFTEAHESLESRERPSPCLRGR